MEQCLREIAEIEKLLWSGHPDVEGLCLALGDWRTELRMIQSMSGGMPLAKRELEQGR
jgi:hypothetical protein